MTSRQQQRFESLLHEHRRIVFKVAGLYSRIAADRDDLVQEISAQLWRSFGGYDEARAKFSTGMYRIALNVAISQARRWPETDRFEPLETHHLETVGGGGQSLQIAFGVAAMLWGISFWTTHAGVLHQVVCGIALQLFGMLMVVFGGRLLWQLQSIDYAAPVLEIQHRLARLRAWRVRVEAPLFVVLGSIVWVPAMLMLIQYDFDQWGGDYWSHAPGLAGHMVLSGIVSLVLVVPAYWLIRRAGHRRWLENNFAGSAVRKGETMPEEIARFEQE